MIRFQRGPIAATPVNPKVLRSTLATATTRLESNTTHRGRAEDWKEGASYLGSMPEFLHTLNQRLSTSFSFFEHYQQLLHSPHRQDHLNITGCEQREGLQLAHGC